MKFVIINARKKQKEPSDRTGSIQMKFSVLTMLSRNEILACEKKILMKFPGMN